MALKREPLIWGIVIVVFLVAPAIYFVEKPASIDPATILAIVETTVTVVAILFAAFVSWAWHWPLFYRWFVRVPDMRGTWRGTLTPIKQDGSVGAPIQSTLVIRQTLNTVSCTVYTENMESKSFSGSAYIDEGNDDERLVYSYSTDPILAQRETNPRSDGTVILVLRQENPKTISGRYFTDRYTRGDMHLAFHSKKIDTALPPKPMAA